MFSLEDIMEHGEVFLTTFPEGSKFAWRLLTLKEYRVFNALRESKILQPFSLYSQVFDRCYLGDPNMISEMLHAGIFISLGELIMWLSGDCMATTQKEDLAAARKNYPANSVVEVMKRIVLIAFPAYKPEELENWTRNELIRKFTMGEALLVNREPEYKPLEINKIKMGGEQKPHGLPIDIEQENSELNKVDMGRDHILDSSPDVLAGRMRNAARLNPQTARALDSTTRPRVRQK